jgi:hypothetical protein
MNVKELKKLVAPYMEKEETGWFIDVEENKIIEKVAGIPFNKAIYKCEEDMLNASPYIRIKSKKDEDATLISINDEPGIFMYDIQKLVNGEWEDIPNDEGLQPQVLIQNGTLEKYDIVRFVGIHEVECAVDTDEELLVDMHGLFMVAVTAEDFVDTVTDVTYDALDLDSDDDEDDDCDCGHDHSTPDLDEMITLVPVSPLIEYLRAYGPVLKLAGVEIDKIESEEQ